MTKCENNTNNYTRKTATDVNISHISFKWTLIDDYCLFTQCRQIEVGLRADFREFTEIVFAMN